MDGSTVRIENSTKRHAESLKDVLVNYQTTLVRRDGSWQLEVQLGELGRLLLGLFDQVGSWCAREQVDSLLLHFDERQYVLLRPSSERQQDSQAFLLERVAQLETALEARVATEQAKGILASALGVTIDEAFETLRRTARSRRQNLRELAAQIAADPAKAKAVVESKDDA